MTEQELDHGVERSIQELDRAECLELLASATIGRLVYTYRALPQVIPVNFRLDDGAVVVRVGSRSHAAQTALDTVVAFQTDRIDEQTRTGWSVLVVGLSRRMDPAVEGDGLQPWVGGEHDLYIKIALDQVSGRRLGVTGGVSFLTE
jgi:hypothetical protein